MEHGGVLNTVEENDRKYEMMNNGVNSQAFQTMESIGLNLFSVQRFRDAGYDKRRRRLWILARTGTESHYPHLHNRDLEQNVYFLKRYDEPMDATYELLLFSLPENVKLKHVPLPDLAAIARKSLERIDSGKMNALEIEMLKKISDFMESQVES
jgi:DNA-binding Xre family transcriptional regulator